MPDLDYSGDPVDLWVALADLTTPPAWWADAACRGAGVEVFFPDSGLKTPAAMKLCADCPAKEPCLRSAMEHPLTSGTWAGSSLQERRQLRRNGRSAA